MIYTLWVCFSSSYVWANIGTTRAEELGKLDGKRLEARFFKDVNSTDTKLLGERFVKPIQCCLKGFRDVDVGLPQACQAKVLEKFRCEVLEPVVDIVTRPL